MCSRTIKINYLTTFSLNHKIIKFLLFFGSNIKFCSDQLPKGFSLYKLGEQLVDRLDNLKSICVSSVVEFFFFFLILLDCVEIKINLGNFINQFSTLNFPL